VFKLQIKGRFDSKSSLYFDICRESYKDFEKYNAEFLKKIKNRNTLASHNWSDLLELSEIRRRCWVQAIIFGALCLEAFVYDYAASHFSDTFTKEYLEKLEFMAKWVLIPKLVTGRDFPRANQAFEHLTKLVSQRNQLVHAKSKRTPSNEEELKALAEGYKSAKRGTLNPYQTVIEVLTELRNLEDAAVESTCWELVKLDG